MKNASKRHLRAIGRRQRDLGDGLQHHPELGLLDVLQHHLLAALLADDPLVVGQVERRCLHAAVAVAGREDDVDDTDRRQRAQRRVPQRRVDGQMVLDVLQMRAEPLQPGRLDVVAQRDEGLEGRLVVEPLVLVDLVRPDGRLDARVEFHPGDVGFVVVVAQERSGPRLEKPLQRGLRRQRRGLAQQSRCLPQFALVLEAVRHQLKRRRAAGRSAPDRREEAPRLGLLGRRQRRQSSARRRPWSRRPDRSWPLRAWPTAHRPGTADCDRAATTGPC